jgi:putative redox protein
MQHKTVVTEWQNSGMIFTGGAEGGPVVQIDGDSGEGPSPVDTALIALAGCTGSDVVLIAEKKRIALKALRIEAHAQRRDEVPRRFTAINLVFHITAPGATEAALRQAIDLSLEKYCSVGHSLNPDIPITYELRLQA